MCQLCCLLVGERLVAVEMELAVGKLALFLLVELPCFVPDSEE